MAWTKTLEHDTYPKDRKGEIELSQIRETEKEQNDEL